MSSQVFLFLNSGELLKSGDIALLEEWQPSDQKLWLDIDSSDTDFARKILEQRFDVPSLMVDDALHKRHPPKFERTGELRFLLLRGLDQHTTDIQFNTIQLALFFSENWLVTRHSAPSVSVAYTQELLSKGKLNASHIGNLVYQICRKVHDRYMPIVLQLEERLEQIEVELLEHPSDDLLGELLRYSRELKRLRRISGYHHRTYRRLESDGLDSEELQHELTDLTEQSERLESSAQLHQEVTSDLINGYISVSSHRLNQIMKVLTIVTVIFVPLTFMAGIYGMNFEHMPELKWKYSYFILLGIMASSGIGLLWLFRRFKWI